MMGLSLIRNSRVSESSSDDETRVRIFVKLHAGVDLPC